VSHPETVASHNRVLRYEFKERMNHWVLPGSFIYLMLDRSRLLVALALLIASALGPNCRRMLHPGSGSFSCGGLLLFRCGPAR